MNHDKGFFQIVMKVIEQYFEFGNFMGIRRIDRNSVNEVVVEYSNGDMYRVRVQRINPSEKYLNKYTLLE